jgi:hypothetical protein
MTTDHLPAPDAPLATISVDQMESYIAAGRAERWTQPLGDMIPVAALLDGDWESHEDDEGTRTWILRSGAWYAVWDGSDAGDVYELAPPELAAVLTDFQARLRTANDLVADADAQHGTPFVVEGEVVPTQRSPEP